SAGSTTSWALRTGATAGSTTGLSSSHPAAVQAAGQPGVQLRSVAPCMSHTLARFCSCNPGPDLPASPVDQSLVPQQLPAGIVLRVRRRHPLQLQTAHLVLLLTQPGDDRNQLPARRVRRDRLT